jgi:hypothetical protein
VNLFREVSHDIIQTMITLNAEVTKVEVKKTLSMDKEFKIIMVTDSEEALKLAEFINDRPVKLTVEAIAP